MRTIVPLDLDTLATSVSRTGRCLIAHEATRFSGFGAELDAIRQRIGAADRATAAVLPILYGGSVKPGNAAELFAQADVDGGLIGGASLVAADFVAICAAAARKG